MTNQTKEQLPVSGGRPTPPNPISVGRRSTSVSWPVMAMAKYVEAAEAHITYLEAEVARLQSVQQVLIGLSGGFAMLHEAVEFGNTVSALSLMDAMEHRINFALAAKAAPSDKGARR